jgi:putative flippase GtrA
MRVFFSKSFIKFVAIGAIAALVNFISRYFINKYTGFKVSLILAYILGMITAYFLFKKYVFRKTKNSLVVSGSYFLLVNLVGICTCFVVSVALAHYVFPYIGFHWHSYEVAHAVGIIMPTFTSFIGHNRFSFQQ